MSPVRIGEYAVERTLGTGSFGEVLLARDASGEAVAIKLLHRGSVPDDDGLRRFGRETRAALGVRHPNVVAALGAGTFEGRPYLVCEYAPGGSLQDRLDRERRFPPAVALAVAADVLRGLGAIHRAGLVHRDVKPANVLLAADGRAQVADLGLTRSVSVQRTLLTQEGMILGTPAYVAPDQIQHGESVDGRADLYSTGVMLYQMLTGDLPFRAVDPIELLRAHVESRPPDPGQSAPLPPRVSAFVLRLLAKRPTDRPRDAAAALSELEALGPAAPAAIAATLADAAPDGGSDRQADARTLPDEPGPSPAAARGDAALRLRDETGAILFLYSSEELVLGRDAAAGDARRVCLRALAGPDAGQRSLRISGKHCALRRTGSRWMVRDLGGANGTLLDGERLAPDVERELRDGSLVSVAGVVELRARLVAPAGRAETGAAGPGAAGEATVPRSLLLERIGDGASHRYLCVAAPAALDLDARPVGVGTGDRTVLEGDGLLWTRAGSTLRPARELVVGNLRALPLQPDDQKH